MYQNAATERSSSQPSPMIACYPPPPIDPMRSSVTVRFRVSGRGARYAGSLLSRT